MKLLLDMNLSPRFVAMLAEEGFEAAHWSEVGPAPADDIDIVAYARTHDLVVITHDLDFSAILAATNGAKPSVVQIRVADMTPAFLLGPVVAGLRRCSDDLQAGALLKIDIDRQRLRLLPLRPAP
jgi:predicted nuclease of predicted toxin-antitoxin system